MIVAARIWDVPIPTNLAILLREDFTEFILNAFTYHRIAIDVSDIRFQLIFNKKIDHIKILR